MSTSFPRSSPYAALVPVLRPRSSGVEAFGLTDTGRQRATNEDAYAVAADLGLYVVADGVGGNAAGEVASRLAIDSVVAFFKDVAAGRPGPGDGQEAAWQASFAASLLARAVEEANAVVWATAAGNPAMTGMATTFTCLLLRHEHAVLAHVGDSRAYLLRGRRLRQLTDDHTAVAAYRQAGVLTAEEAATSPFRGILARAVGCDEHVEVDTRIARRRAGRHVPALLRRPPRRPRGGRHRGHPGRRAGPHPRRGEVDRAGERRRRTGQRDCRARAHVRDRGLIECPSRSRSWSSTTTTGSRASSRAFSNPSTTSLS